MSEVETPTDQGMVLFYDYIPAQAKPITAKLVGRKLTEANPYKLAEVLVSLASSSKSQNT